jgi:hypothetical protein
MAKYVQVTEACYWDGDNIDSILNTFSKLEGATFKKTKKGLLKISTTEGMELFKVQPGYYITFSNGVLHIHTKVDFERVFKKLEMPILMAKGADA